MKSHKGCLRYDPNPRDPCFVRQRQHMKSREGCLQYDTGHEYKSYTFM